MHHVYKKWVNIICIINILPATGFKRGSWGSITLPHFFVPSMSAMRTELSGTGDQTEDIEPLLAQYWSIVCDAGPTFGQQWFNVTMVQCLVSAGVEPCHGDR